MAVPSLQNGASCSDVRNNRNQPITTANHVTNAAAHRQLLLSDCCSLMEKIKARFSGTEKWRTPGACQMALDQFAEGTASEHHLRGVWEHGLHHEKDLLNQFKRICYGKAEPVVKEKDKKPLGVGGGTQPAFALPPAALVVEEVSSILTSPSIRGSSFGSTTCSRIITSVANATRQNSIQSSEIPSTGSAKAWITAQQTPHHEHGLQKRDSVRERSEVENTHDAKKPKTSNDGEKAATPPTRSVHFILPSRPEPVRPQPLLSPDLAHTIFSIVAGIPTTDPPPAPDEANQNERNFTLAKGTLLQAQRQAQSKGVVSETFNIARSLLNMYDARPQQGNDGSDKAGEASSVPDGVDTARSPSTENSSFWQKGLQKLSLEGKKKVSDKADDTPIENEGRSMTYAEYRCRVDPYIITTSRLLPTILIHSPIPERQIANLDVIVEGTAPEIPNSSAVELEPKSSSKGKQIARMPDGTLFDEDDPDSRLRARINSLGIRKSGRAVNVRDLDDEMKRYLRGRGFRLHYPPDEEEEEDREELMKRGEGSKSGSGSGGKGKGGFDIRLG
ncbi:hypothetical protein GQ43DRAFT_481603 [Delitschia confertaspora ATCC 74209]|uniref:Uncharacterized protein n=1 Tax=Delitschia confertaspora ATCC 74209 TaxID=1513339 RepID=A0A9P4JLG0_9PLEO|nr:hypothetical protein GQ43DRAFT_481603 [Delitschia confertaspora ATCC 74209]